MPTITRPSFSVNTKTPGSTAFDVREARQFIATMEAAPAEQRAEAAFDA